MAVNPEAVARARELHRAGQLPQAEQVCREILAADPQHPETLNLLGVIALQIGEMQAALDCLGRAVAARPDVASYHNDLAAACLNVGRLDEAVAACRRALEIDANFAEGHFNLAVILRAAGKLDEAAESCRKALAIRPDYVDAQNNLGIVLQDLGRLDEAVACYRRTLEIRPDYARAYNNLGSALVEQGNYGEAVAACERALQINPRYVEALYNQGNAFAGQRNYDAAVTCYRQALTLRPDHVAACNKLAGTLREQGQFDEAIAIHRQALQVMPQNVEACHSLAIIHEERGELREAVACYQQIQKAAPNEPLWALRASTLCPNVFPNAEQIDKYRAQLLENLQRFSQRNLPVDLAKLPILGTGPPYDLQFHGRDDRPIKEAYAEIFRGWGPGEAPQVSGKRYRIGFVVTDPHEPIFLKCMRGVLNHLDANRFEPVVICSPAGAAMVRPVVNGDVVDVLPIPDRVDQAAQLIRGGNFDLLYYWEVGSGTANYFLPFFRLARVQCTGWGLPVTSGIPQMDYFLSSDLVEPEEADLHYRERLIRASTLLTYQYRMSLPDRVKTRENFGFTPDRHVYACLQQTQKLHPDFDPILAEILRRDEAAVIIIPRDPHVMNTARLGSRFAAQMPDLAKRILFVPQQAYFDYLGLVAAVDVLLDSLHFGGGLTTYDAFSLCQPVVTLPGEFRRGRFTAACYRKMGIAQCVASDPEDYVRIALTLANEPDYRAAAVKEIREASPVLFEDMEAVGQYEQIFEELIEKARAR